MRLLTPFFMTIALMIVPAHTDAQAYRENANTTAFPLTDNIMFPARETRTSLICQNATTNAAATLIFPSGMQIVLQAGGSIVLQAQSNLRGRVPNGVIQATGTAGQTLRCEEMYY